MMNKFAKKIYEYPDEGIQAVVIIRAETIDHGSGVDFKRYKVHIMDNMTDDPVILGWNNNTMEDAKIVFDKLTSDIVYDFIKNIGNRAKSYEVLSAFSERMV